MTPPAAAEARLLSLADTFVSLADTLVDDYDVVELLHTLVMSSVSLLGASAAGLLLDDSRGGLAVMASSREDIRLLEVFQLQADDGPCLDCAHSKRAVVSTDLAQDVVRWPRFAPAALETGFTSVVAVPLRLRDVTIGALGLFNESGTVLSELDQRLAQALADVATIGVLQQRTAHRSSQLAEQLQAALNSRVIIEQAKGVIAERQGLGMAAAFDQLRRGARDRNLKLADHALRVVRGEQSAI